MTRDWDKLEQDRMRRSMSFTITTKDPDYAKYAGGSLPDMLRMAVFDTLMENDIFPEEFKPLLILARQIEDRKRKAHFATVGSSEISKLGWILGTYKFTGKSAAGPL